MFDIYEYIYNSLLGLVDEDDVDLLFDISIFIHKTFFIMRINLERSL